MNIITSAPASSATGLRHTAPGIATVVGRIWLIALGLLLVLSAYNSFQVASRVQEFAYASDRFGYLNMARQIRDAATHHHLPRFWIDSSQMSILISFLQTYNVPTKNWADLVAPLCYHYFPKSGHIGANPPPGTGLMLALFPEGKAVVRLNKLVIALLLATGITTLVLAGIRRLWVSGGFLTLAIYLGLQVIKRIDTWSFSINAVMAQLLLMFICIVLAFALEAHPKYVRAARFTNFLAGLLFGLAVLIRLPVALLGPGLLVLLWRVPWRNSLRSRVVPFMLGTLISGLLPILAFQYHETGAWYLPTYGPGDASPPSVQALKPTLPYYFAGGPGSTDNWAFLVSFVGTLALVLCRRGDNHSAGSALTWNRLVGSALLLWGIPVVYFLTHKVVTPYYLVPSTFGAVLLLALGTLTIDWSAPQNQSKQHSANGIYFHPVVLAFSLLPGVAVLCGGWPPSLPSIIRKDNLKPRAHQVILPSRLTDPNAWIWANYLTGTFWYYGHKPAFDIYYSDAQTRAQIYGLVFARSEPQYIVEDSPWMESVIDEIYRMGGVLEPIAGGVEGSPYFLIHWPTGGPRNGPTKKAGHNWQQKLTASHNLIDGLS